MKILIVQTRRLGDILLTTPVISYLKAAIPGAQVDFLCEPMGKLVLDMHPDLGTLHLYDKKTPLKEISWVRNQKYDAVLDFMNNPRTAYLTALSGAKWKVGFKKGIRSVFYNIAVPVPKDPEYGPLRKIRMARTWLEAAGITPPKDFRFQPVIHLSSEDNAFADKWIASEHLEGKPFAVMAPVQRHLIRQWRPEGFRETGLHIADTYGMPVYLAWGPGEDAVVDFIRQGTQDKLKLLPATSMRQMGAIFKRAKVLVTNDSGAMHLGVSMGVPTVTIYGPTRPVDWNPSYAVKGVTTHDRAVMAEEVACLGCHLLKCPVGHLCMSRLESKRVNLKVDSLLKGELK